MQSTKTGRELISEDKVIDYPSGKLTEISNEFTKQSINMFSLLYSIEDSLNKLYYEHKDEKGCTPEVQKLPNDVIEGLFRNKLDFDIVSTRLMEIKERLSKIV